MKRNIILSISLIFFSIALIVSAKIISKSLENASLNIQYGFSAFRTSTINNTNEDRDIISTFEAAQLLGTTEKMLTSLIDNKKIDIPCTRVDTYYVFSKKAISQWLETSHKVN